MSCMGTRCVVHTSDPREMEEELSCSKPAMAT